MSFNPFGSGSGGGGMGASVGAGAAMGALAGTIVAPGIGTAVGAGLGAGMSLLTSFLGAKSASKNNDAIQTAIKLAQTQGLERGAAIGKAAQFEREGIMADAELARTMHGREATKLRGMLRAATAESGTTLAGSRSRILDQADWEALFTRKALEDRVARALRRVDLNMGTQLLSNQQTVENAVTGYEGGTINPDLAGFNAGLGGFSSGLSIVGGSISTGKAIATL